MEEIVHILVHAALDSLKVFPFLFLMYVLIELLEHRTNITKNKNVLTGNLAPLLGAATGIIPQCGFSVMAAKLYDKKLIRTGTVLAVFFATSDEAIVLLLSSGSGAKTVAVMPVIAILLRYLWRRDIYSMRCFVGNRLRNWERAKRSAVLPAAMITNTIKITIFTVIFYIRLNTLCRFLFIF